VQSALHPASAGAAFAQTSPWVARRNQILIGSVAALTASVIAVAPAAQNGVSLELHQAQQRAVELAAQVSVAVGDSPLAVYGGLLNNTVYNLQGLLSTYASDPLPILSTIAENQIGYLKRIFDLSVVSTAFQTWWNDGTRESLPGKTLVATVGSNLASGNLFAAYENLNKLVLFGVQNTVLPWLNNWLFTSATSVGVPQQILQNVTDAVGSFLTTGTLVFGAFQAVYAPVSGAFFELSRSLGAVGNTLASGNLAGAVTALVNTPGVVLNAFVNGFDYSATQNPWAGLLSWRDPSCTGRCSSGGPISEFFITIAKKIAAAITNTPAATTTASTTAAAATSLVAANVDTAATTYTLSVDGSASPEQTAEAASDATPESASADAASPAPEAAPAEEAVIETPAQVAQTPTVVDADAETTTDPEVVEDTVAAEDEVTATAPEKTASRHGVTAKKPASQPRSAHSAGASSPKRAASHDAA